MGFLEIESWKNLLENAKGIPGISGPLWTLMTCQSKLKMHYRTKCYPHSKSNKLFCNENKLAWKEAISHFSSVSYYAFQKRKWAEDTCGKYKYSGCWISGISHQIGHFLRTCDGFHICQTNEELNIIRNTGVAETEYHMWADSQKKKSLQMTILIKLTHFFVKI